MKNKIKKAVLLSLAFVPFNVFAASSSISAPSSVEVGSSVTAKVTLKGTAAWNVSINSSGSTSGCSQKFADATGDGNNTTKVLSVTCKATSIGAIGFTVTGDITSADGSNSNVALSKRVTVTAVKPKSSDNNLKSLSIEGYEISPEFKKDTLEYTATVPSTVDKINIIANKNDSTASVEGAGEKEVVEGSNPFEIVVTAQNGSTKTYKLVVTVEDINPIELTIDGKKYSVVKRKDNLEKKPTGFDETTVKIGEFDIPGFKSETLDLTLVGIKDEEGKISLAIYEDGKYKEYKELNSNQITLYLLDLPKNDDYTKTTIKINGKEVEVYKYNKNSKYSLVYGKNVENGKEDYYMYDEVEGTFQRYNEEQLEELNEQLNNYLYVIYAFSGCLGLIFLCFIISKCAKSKAKKKAKLKEMNSEKDKEKENKEIIEDFLDEKKKSKSKSKKK